MLNPNTTVGGRYKVIKPLGGGGMKLVYLAEDLRLAARRCALAEMVDNFTSPDMQRQAVSAFQREADMLAQLNNEHIPHIFDRFSEQNHHYLVMEYIEGVTLDEMLKAAGGKLDSSRAVDIALQILDTLIYLHGLNPPVVYRDLKPSNVMVLPGGQVKLIDFGIARHFQPLTNATMIGTQGYAPPEQYRGKIETRSDLYALGATMHHALSGRDPTSEPPFSFPPLRKIAPDTNPALAELVSEALAYDVDRRIRDALEFRRRLLDIRSGTGAFANSTLNAPASRSKSQSSLPFPGPAPAAASSPSAPTVLTDATETPCPSCRRHIPVDSLFCSFCGGDLRRVLGPAEVVSNHDADTWTLSEQDAPLHQPGGKSYGAHQRTAHRRGALFYAFTLAAIFVALYLIVLALIPYFHPDSSDLGPRYGAPDAGSLAPSYPEPPEAAPEGKEPVHRSPRAIALRRSLDAQGYRGVHFRFDRDTVELWGSVPTWADRMMVQATVYSVTGFMSLEDRLKVQNEELGFGDEP